MSSEAKLDLILQQLQHQQQQLKALGPIQNALEDLKNSLGNVKEDVKNLQYDVADHHNRLAALEKDMIEQKDVSNTQQQQLRSFTLRLLNFPVIVGEADDNYSGIRARVYDVVLKLLLTAAKAAKDLSSVPQMATVMEACFRPFNAAANSEGPPQVIIKVTSKPIKIAILKQKKNLPKPVGQDKKLILVEDLTPATFKMLSAIAKSKKAAKVWTIEGVIKYTVEGQPGTKTVKSVFDPLSKIFPNSPL